MGVVKWVWCGNISFMLLLARFVSGYYHHYLVVLVYTKYSCSPFLDADAVGLARRGRISARPKVSTRGSHLFTS